MHSVQSMWLSVYLHRHSIEKLYNNNEYDIRTSWHYFLSRVNWNKTSCWPEHCENPSSWTSENRLKMIFLSCWNLSRINSSTTYLQAYWQSSASSESLYLPLKQYSFRLVIEDFRILNTYVFKKIVDGTIFLVFQSRHCQRRGRLQRNASLFSTKHEHYLRPPTQFFKMRSGDLFKIIITTSQTTMLF